MQSLSFNQLSGKSWLSCQRAVDKKWHLYASVMKKTTLLQCYEGTTHLLSFELELLLREFCTG